MARVVTSTRSATANGDPPSPLSGQQNEPSSNTRMAGTHATVSYEALAPGGPRDLSHIALQAFGLGFTLATCLGAAIYAIEDGRPIWRLPAFFVCLSIFHFLEFYTTARWNLPAAKADSFLLFNNGGAYTLAHAMATLEMCVSNFLPAYQALFVNRYTIGIGVLLVLVGQFTRSCAMAQAGTNFNHKIQQERKDSHELVTTGIYRYLRHPSYFGFFYWALGTQFLVGNKICLVGYAVVLWRFFYRRIRTEERYLLHFFDDYEEYRKRTGTMIPFVR